MTIKTISAAVAATSLTIAASAMGVAITPGQTAFAVNENNPVGGTTLATLPAPFSTANYTGTLVTTVIQGDTSNPYGGLTFTYQLFNDVTSANSLTRLTVPGFTGYATDNSYKLGTGTITPTSTDRDAGGGVVGFSFMGQPLGLGVVSPGGSSELLVVQTNSLSFNPRQANISNGAVSQITSYGPAGAITPEPATLTALAGAGLLFGRRRRA